MKSALRDSHGLYIVFLNCLNSAAQQGKQLCALRWVEVLSGDLL